MFHILTSIKILYILSKMYIIVVRLVSDIDLDVIIYEDRETE